MLADRVTAFGIRLVALGSEFTKDINERHLLAHKALRILLRNDPTLARINPMALRHALHLAAAARQRAREASADASLDSRASF